MKLAALLRNLPIRRKLMAIALLATVMALVVAATVLLAQQWYELRAALVATTASQADIVATNSTAALSFDDRKAATETLGALAAIDNIEFAELQDQQGDVFASYLRAGGALPPPHHPSAQAGHYFGATYVDVFRPVALKGERLGIIHLRAGLAQIYRQMAWSVMMVVLAALAGLAAALALIARLHPAITGPMGELVDLMAAVSRDKNYALRAPPGGTDEIGQLAAGLNDMLVQIQLRDSMLEEHRARLEQQVAERTGQLTNANRQLGKLNEELDQKVKERTQQLLVAQDDLVRQEKLAVLGQVAGSVGHELRNPLGVMSNAVFFLQTVLADADATTMEYLGIIKDEIAGAERIVADLLDSVRTKPPRSEPVALAELVSQALRKLPPPSSVAVRLDLPLTLPRLHVDPLQTQQVLRNLVANAFDAMADGGTLDIRAREDATAKTVIVDVQDSGCGMAPEQLARLFQPLFTTKARGIGLGLVVVKNLTRANGGKVHVQSEPGRGTTFTLTLPAVGRDEVADA